MTRSERLTLIATIMASTVVFLDGTVVNVALPAMERDLGMGLAGQQWVVEAYLLALVSLMLVGGSLGDHFGRRRIFSIGLAAFGVSSILCALAPSTGVLIGLRGVQGLAGAMLVPGSLAILAATFDGEARGRAIGTWTAWSGISTVAGPAAGGFLIQALSWRYVFWLNVPLIAATLLLTAHSVAESRDPDAVKGFDIPGVILSALGLGGPVFALIEQPTYGWTDPLVLVPLLAGVACFAAFLAREALARAPMLPLSLFRVRNFAIANAATLTTYAGLIGALFFLTLYLQQVVGYTALAAGFATVPVSLLLFFLSPRFGALTARLGPRLPMSLGPIVGGLGLLLMLRVGVNPSYAGEVLPALVLFGLGLAATVAPLTTTVLSSVDEHNAGIASGVNNSIARVAGLLCIAVLGAVISAHFVSKLDERLSGDTLRGKAASVVDSAKSRPLAGGDEAKRLSGSERDTVGTAIESSSRDAFHLALVIGGCLMIAGGLTSAIGIQNPRRRPAPTPVPRAVTAGECARPSGFRDSEPVPGALEPVPGPAEAPL
ncbi:MAG TPA: MFS transporter [Candidatus Acidoferrum sp.]|nr:MFS transporter [Candidatus Acidoferrum sp.]